MRGRIARRLRNQEYAIPCAGFFHYGDLHGEVCKWSGGKVFGCSAVARLTVDPSNDLGS